MRKHWCLYGLGLSFGVLAAVLFGTSGSAQLAPQPPAQLIAPAAPVGVAVSQPRALVRKDRLAVPGPADTRAGRISIPAIGADANLVWASKLLPNGFFPVPDNVSQVGAYEVPGTTIMSGHVDSHESGLGALHLLSLVQTGDDIWADGQHYRVVYAHLFPKSTLAQAGLLEGVWNAHSAPGRLVVVSCWGDFSNGHYNSNQVVVAVKI